VRSLAVVSIALVPLPAVSGTLHVPGDYPTIAAALAAAQAGTLVEIACGTYFEHDLVLETGVVVTSATGRPECTVIDAQHAGRGFVAIGVAGCDVVGVTIRDAVPAEPAAPGGGLFCSGSTVSLSSCTFERCTSAADGGAIHAVSSLLTIDVCRFESNRAGGRGGAIRGDGAETHLIGCTFVDNAAARDGAVHLENAPFAVYEACRFERNSSDSASGAFGARDSAAGLFGCHFIGNGAGDTGGGAAVGGASSILFQGCVFRDNLARRAGGGLAIGPGAQSEVERCTFDRNRAEGAGRGGGLCVEGGRVALRRTVLVRNSGAHLVLAEGQAGPATADVSNCILAFGEGPDPVGCDPGASLRVACTDVFANAAGDWIGCLAPWAGLDGNFSADPLFCDIDASDFSIRSDSPCTAAASGCGLVGAIDVGCEPAPVRAESWGRVKARWR
jgi:predicted outer membrane repeat protein